MNIISIHSFNEYIQYTENLKGQFYFRGQSNAAWNIIPSIFRNTDAFSLSMERNAISERRKKNPKQSPIEAVFHMQHYGEATRFCDLTISPLAALFFASEGETDGAVFVIRKDSAININSYEIDVFSQVLVRDIASLSEIEIDASLSLDVEEILSNNHVVEYKNLGYSNPRAFRQGGTGILFGFGVDENALSLSGNVDVDGLIVNKLEIAKTAKAKILSELRQLGYSKEMLLDHMGEIYEPEDVSVTQTSFTIERRFDKGYFNKIVAQYRLNTLYYNRDDLALQINDLYADLFNKYGENARIWTYFYFDKNDVAGANWICMGWWNKENQYEIRWTKEYQAYRLNRFNEQISSEAAINKMITLADEITPIYNDIFNYVSQPDYSLQGFFAVLQDVQPVVRKICDTAGNVPYTDLEHQKLPDSAWSYINNIDWLIGDMLIFSKRPDMKEQVIRWMLHKTYISACEKSKCEFEKLLN